MVSGCERKPYYPGTLKVTGCVKQLHATANRAVVYRWMPVRITHFTGRLIGARLRKATACNSPLGCGILVDDCERKPYYTGALKGAWLRKATTCNS